MDTQAVILILTIVAGTGAIFIAVFEIKRILYLHSISQRRACESLHPSSFVKKRELLTYRDYTGKVSPLSDKERDHLSAMFNDPTFVRALRLIESNRPNTHFSTGQVGENDWVVARFYELRGWERFKHELFSCCLQNQELSSLEQITEDFPDEGRPYETEQD